MNRAAGSRLATKVWGEDGADASWRDVLRIDDWAQCGSDDYIRVFPKLLNGGGALPGCLLAHLVECVAVRAWRLGSGPGKGPAPASVSSAEVERIGQPRQAGWFADGRSVLQLFSAPPWRPDRAREQGALLFLDRLLLALRSGRAVAFDEAAAVRLAFHAGIHPAYLWPAALGAHERGTAAGWLGYLGRGRAAHMPADVAFYLDDALGWAEAGGIVVRDPPLAAIADENIDLARIGQAARARRRGDATLVRPRLREGGALAGRRLRALPTKSVAVGR